MAYLPATPPETYHRFVKRYSLVNISDGRLAGPTKLAQWLCQCQYTSIHPVTRLPFPVAQVLASLMTQSVIVFCPPI